MKRNADSRIKRYRTRGSTCSNLFQPSRLIMIGCLLVCCILLSGCFQKFYKTNSVNSVDAARMEKLIQENKYFILRANDGAFAMKELKVNNGFLNGVLDTLTAVHGNYLDPKKPAHNRFDAADKQKLLEEVHVYVDRNAMSPIHFPLSEVTRMDVYDFDIKSTHQSTVHSTVGLIVGISTTAVCFIFASSFSGLQNYQ